METITHDNERTPEQKRPRWVPFFGLVGLILSVLALPLLVFLLLGFLGGGNNPEVMRKVQRAIALVGLHPLTALLLPYLKGIGVFVCWFAEWFVYGCLWDTWKHYQRLKA